MKIMYFMDNAQILGGAAHTLLRQAELMKSSGHDVFVVLDCMADRLCEAYKDFCLQKRISTVFMPLHAVSQPEDIDIIFVLTYLEDVKQAIAEERPDILHSVQINPVVELAARELDIPHVMNIYPAISDFFKINFIDLFPRYHICDSQYYADVWEKYLRTKSVCIRTVADRAENGKRQRLQIGNVIKCICVGAVYQMKNQLSVIMACHKALQNGIRLKLYVYGNYAGNPYGEECLQYIQGNNLSEDIELKGFCTNMQEAYHESDVLICGSTRESYPNVISEALANGVTVISTPVAGVPEIIKDRENGYITQGYRSDDLYEKIIELNCDITSRKIDDIRQQAVETYERVHSPESITDELEKYYQWLSANYESKAKISIGELEEKFSKVIEVYFKKESNFTDKIKVQKKLWYLYHIQEKIKAEIDNGKAFYIWGTGKYGRAVYEMMTSFFANIEISGFIDTYKSGYYLERPIYAPNEILGKEKTIILVATFNGQNEIIEQLKTRNKRYTEDYYILASRYW